MTPSRAEGREYGRRVELGVVDLDGPRDAQVAALAAACEQIGLFRLPLSVIPAAVADEAWETAREFFALPLDEKRRVEFPEPGYPYGYSPFGYETLARSLDDADARPDLKESLSVGPDCGPPAPVGLPAVDIGDAWIRSPSLWPGRPARLRPAWEAYYRALSSVAERLMSLMAVALALPADHFDPMIDRPMTSMRAINYPALDGDPGRARRAGAHADYGTLTILRTDAVDGLEILGSDGSWAAVDPQPDMFVVNLGDSIAQWTNDRWRSTIHRVSCARTAQRQSFAFFHMANWDARIECLPTCRVDGEAPRHPPVEAGPWLMRKFRSTVT